MKLPILPRAPFSTVTAISLLMSAAAIALALWPQWAGPAPAARLADEWLRDHIVRLQVVDEPEDRILVVDLDETTLARYPWPWPRARMADLIEKLMGDQARAVALDIVMPEPGEASGDARMAQLAAYGPLVLAQLFDYHKGNFLHEGSLIGGTPAAAPGPAAKATGYMANHAGLARGAHVGNIGVIIDGDGILRRVPLHTWYQGRVYPTLSLALLQCCAATPPAGAIGGKVRVPFRRDWNSYMVVKGSDVLDDRVPPEVVVGRHVLVGSSALSVSDRVSSPLGANTAGLLVHAAMLTSLLDERDGTAPARWPGLAMSLAFSTLVALLAAYMFPRQSAVASVAMLLTATVLWLLLAYVLIPHDPELTVSGPLLSNLFLLTFTVPFHWQLAQRKSQQLIGTLRQYVATAVVDELLRSDLKDPLAPRQAMVTTLIADLEGYTTHVEALPVEEAARLTTDFLDCLTRPVLEMHGTLDKYTGDGLVAFWGAPLPNDDHADLALDAALMIVQEVAALSRLRQRDGLAPLRVRIGIESGLAMAGDYGTTFRSIYTAVGDSVNTASRLEQAARNYPHDVIVGQGTAAAARRHRLTLLGEYQIRGKEKSVTIYTLEASR